MITMFDQPIKKKGSIGNFIQRHLLMKLQWNFISSMKFIEKFDTMKFPFVVEIGYRPRSIAKKARDANFNSYSIAHGLPHSVKGALGVYCVAKIIPALLSDFPSVDWINTTNSSTHSVHVWKAKKYSRTSHNGGAPVVLRRSSTVLHRRRPF